MKLFVLLAGTALVLSAQVDDALARMKASQRQTMEYLHRSAVEITRAAVAEVASKDTWEKVAPRRREEMRRMLGLLPWPERTPLNVKITRTTDRGAYTVENIAFESMPKVYVTANLYLPKNRSGRVPAIVYVCGHSYNERGAKVQYQRHGISFAKNGYAAIMLDPIQIAETFGAHHGGYSQEMYDWFARGYTPAGIEVWNAIRAIDYLESRAEIDASRIGMTGRSGGAAMTLFTAAVDERVKAAMPVMGISTYAANLAEDTQRLHCDCMFAINAYRHDMMHQAALIAPRPLELAHGSKDSLFPVPGYTEVENTMRRLYASYGKLDAFGNTVVDTGHADSDFLRERSVRFFDRHLLGVKDRKLDMSYVNAPAEELAVFPNGAPSDARNFLLHQFFVPPAVTPKYDSLARWEARRSELLQALRKEVFPALPLDIQRPAATAGDKSPNPAYDELTIEADQGVPVRALLSKPAKAASVPALIYVASEGEDVRAATAILNGVKRDDAVRMIVYPRGVGEIPWSKSTWKDMQRNAMHVGETVDSMRLRDVLAAVAAVRGDASVNKSRITVMGKGSAATLALYAGVLDTGIEQVTLLDPPPTHARESFFLNVLRHTDMPEAAAMMAPRRVNFYGSIPPEFEASRQVYSLYGKPNNLWVTTSVAGPVLHKYHHGYASGL